MVTTKPVEAAQMTQRSQDETRGYGLSTDRAPLVAAWFGLVWSAGTSTVVMLTFPEAHVIPFIVPVLASALPVVAGPSIRMRRNLAVFAMVVLLVFIGLAMLSVGWFFVPSFVAAMVSITAAERKAERRNRPNGAGHG